MRKQQKKTGPNIVTKNDLKKKKKEKMDTKGMYFRELVDQCDPQVEKCPRCDYKDLCEKIQQNHTGKPYQYAFNEYTKNQLVDDLLIEKAI